MNIENLKNMPIVGEDPIEVVAVGPGQLPAAGGDTAVSLIASYVQQSNTVIKSQAANNIIQAEAENQQQHDAQRVTEKGNYAAADDNVGTKAGIIVSKIESDKSAQETSANLLITNPTEVKDSITEFAEKLIEDAEQINQSLDDATTALSGKRADFRAKFGTVNQFEAILDVPTYAS